MAVTEPDMSRLDADTQLFYTKTIWDQIKARYPVVSKMKTKNIRSYSGGTEIQIPVITERNNQTEHYKTGQQMGSGTEAKRSYAKFTMVKTQTPIKYDCDDFIENNGTAVTIDTIAAEVAAAQEGLIYELSRNGFGLYDGALDDPDTTKEPLSLNAALTHNPALGGLATYGGITRTSQDDFWNGVSGTDSTNIDLGDAAPVSYDQWDFMVDSCMKHGAQRNRLMAICGSGLYRKWKNLVRAKESGLSAGGSKFTVGFSEFSIDGVDIVLDDNCPASTFYMLDMDTWQWWISSKRNFKVTEFDWQGKYNNGIDEYLARVLLAHTGMICTKPRNNYITTSMN